MSSPPCCQSGCSGSEGALAHLAAQSRQLALPYDHHACIKIESQSSRCECTKPEQHVWIEVVKMQPYSTTWSFPAAQWRYGWLREVYKCIKTFHFSLSTEHMFKVHLPWRNLTKKLQCVWHSDEQNVVERVQRVRSKSLYVQQLEESRGFELVLLDFLVEMWRKLLRYEDLEIRSEQLEFFKIMSP
jgi:hypothetical protein